MHFYFKHLKKTLKLKYIFYLFFYFVILNLNIKNLKIKMIFFLTLFFFVFNLIKKVILMLFIEH